MIECLHFYWLNTRHLLFWSPAESWFVACTVWVRLSFSKAFLCTYALVLNLLLIVDDQFWVLAIAFLALLSCVQNLPAWVAISFQTRYWTSSSILHAFVLLKMFRKRFWYLDCSLLLRFAKFEPSIVRLIIVLPHFRSLILAALLCVDCWLRAFTYICQPLKVQICSALLCVI